MYTFVWAHESQPQLSHFGACTYTWMGPSLLGFATGVGQATSQVGLTGAPVLVKHAVTVAVRTSRGQNSGAAAARGASMAAAIMAERERTLELIFTSLGIVSLQ